MVVVKKLLAVLGLTLVSLVIWMMASGILMPLFNVSVAPMGNVDSSVILMFAAIVFLANTLVLSYMVLRMNWHSWRAAALVFLMYFGVYSFLSTIEAFAFNNSLDIDANLLWANMAGALVLALAFSPLAVWWLGAWNKPASAKYAAPLGRGIPNGQLLLKIILLAAVVYPLLYISFGYYVAWQNPEVRMLYTGSTEIRPFFDQLLYAFTTPIWFYPFQIARALVWIGLAWLFLRTSKAGWVETGIIVGLNFALLMNAQHLIPNPFMPDSVRLSHFLETASSNFLWGFVITWALHRKHASIADLFRRDHHRPISTGRKASVTSGA